MSDCSYVSYIFGLKGRIWIKFPDDYWMLLSCFLSSSHGFMFRFDVNWLWVTWTTRLVYGLVADLILTDDKSKKEP